MYAEHVPLVAEYAAQSPDNFFRVGLFVQCTINRHFEQVPQVVASYDRYSAGTLLLMRWQRESLKYLASEAPRLHASLSRWKRRGRSAAHYAIRELVELPGFGIVKAAFFAQLVLPGGHVGCLDRHNLRLAGLSERAFSRIPVSTEGLTRKINTYLGLCKDLGGSETLWDNWCRYLAALRPHSFASGEAVSELHVKCIMG